MKSVQILPEGYKEELSIDLQKDKKLAIIVNILALVIAIIMCVAMHFYIPFWTLFDMSKGLGAYFTRFFILMVSIIIYLVLHELVHGITMKCYGCKKVKYGFTGLYAYAGSDEYFYKKPYIVIALAPIVVWGVVLAILNVIVPVEYFWIVYFIQVCNVSGAAGDLYVTFKFAKLPEDTLIQDYGVGMKVYTK